MEQYQELLKNILQNGVEKESGRANMPNTIGISHATMKFDLKDGFPLLTTKKMYLKGIIHELLWFLRGDTNIKYLVDNNVNIWNGDAYRWYLTKHEQYNSHYELIKSIEEFVDTIKHSDSSIVQTGIPNYKLGDLGKVYGYQWRNQNGVDQVKEVLEGLKSNPYSRYHIIDGWNKADFKDMALPPCHLLYQFIVRPLSQDEQQHYAITHDMYDGVGGWSEKVPKFYLDLNMYQRSCDTFLGVPFNIASMSLLLMIFAKASGMQPGVATWIGGDTHLYVTHKEQANEQIERLARKLPTLTITKGINSLQDIENLTIEDFKLDGYDPHPAIKAELSTGLKK